jgi:hemerythrin
LIITKKVDNKHKISDKVINTYLNNKDKKPKQEDKETGKVEEVIEQKKDNIKPHMSDMYENDYQYSRAYDLIHGLSLGIEGASKKQ